MREGLQKKPGTLIFYLKAYDHLFEERLCVHFEKKPCGICIAARKVLLISWILNQFSALQFSLWNRENFTGTGNKAS